nr:glycosyltransferase family 4 protein [Microbacterium sp. TS-1]
MTVLRRGPRHTARGITGKGLRANVLLAARLLRSASTLAAARAVRNADVVVANTTRSAVYTALACTVLRKPYVVHIRDLVNSDGVGSAATALMRRIVLPRASAVIANSRASLSLVSPFLHKGALGAVVPSPAGLTISDDDPRPDSREPRTIGMVARLDPWKGQELLVDAFADAFPDGDVRLVLFGGPSFGHEGFVDRLQELARSRGVADRLDLPGHVSDVEAAIKSLDICVQCSLRPEPLGQNVLQYLAAGKPSIVSSEGGPAEWVEDEVNGLVFSARDRSSLAHSLRRLAADGELRSKLAIAARRTPDLLDDSSVAREITGVLEAASGRRS